jgi:beta-lactamase superfamily II metal-dependent hydrolase
MLFLAIWAILVGGSTQEEAARLIFLDVGQGDGMVIVSPEGRVALVDAGPAELDLPGLLWSHGIEAIDIAIATHPHADHIGSMASVLRSMPVRYYMDNGEAHTTETYRELMETLGRSDLEYVEATERTIQLGSVTLTVLPRPDTSSNINNLSIGLLVEFGSFRALLTGDSEVEELNHFLSSGVPDVTLLKAAHHGSRDAVTPAWLNATSPEVVVISVGLDNPYGSPDPWALRYYEAVASEMYRTDLDGEVVVTMYRDGSYDIGTAKMRERPGGGE